MSAPKKHQGFAADTLYWDAEGLCSNHQYTGVAQTWAQKAKLRSTADSLTRRWGVRRGPAFKSAPRKLGPWFWQITSWAGAYTGWTRAKGYVMPSNCRDLQCWVGCWEEMGVPSSTRQIPDEDKQSTSRETEPGKFSPITSLGLCALQGCDMSRSRWRNYSEQVRISPIALQTSTYR